MKRHKIRNGGYAEHVAPRGITWSAYIFLDQETDVPEMEVPITWTDKIETMAGNPHVPVFFKSRERADMFLHAEGPRIVLLGVNKDPNSDNPQIKSFEKLVLVKPVVPIGNERTILSRIIEDVNLRA